MQGASSPSRHLALTAILASTTLASAVACQTPQSQPDDSGPAEPSSPFVLDDPPTPPVLEGPPLPLVWEGCTSIYAPGTMGEPDARQAFSPSVLDGRIWFGVKGETNPQRVAMGSIEVADGLPVVTEPHLVIDPDVFGQFFDASSPSALRNEDGSLSLYFDAISDKEGLGLWRCDSDDDEMWRSCGPILSAGTLGSKDAMAAQIPRVVDMGDHLRLWYTALDADGVRRIATARSADGWDWEDATLALDLGAEGTWDTNSLYSAFVFPDAGGYRMLYAGRATYKGYEAKRLIEAWSEDGLVWTRFSQSMDLGCQGEADSWRADAPWVVAEESGWRLYYDGFDDPLTEEGYRSLLTATAAK
jgi:hypothetical protein